MVGSAEDWMWAMRNIGTDVGNLDPAQRRPGSDFSARGAPWAWARFLPYRCRGLFRLLASQRVVDKTGGEKGEGSEAAVQLLKRDSTEILGGLWRRLHSVTSVSAERLRGT